MRRRKARAISGFVRRRAVLVPAAVLVVALALALQHSSGQRELTGQAGVSDGDSFHLGDTRIRLAGLDAPELDQVCPMPDGSDWACGQAARAALADLLAAGPVTCSAQGQDRYDRMIARCSVAGSDLGSSLVQQGLAVSAGDYWTEHLAARARGIGIWEGGFDLPASWRRQSAP